MNITEKIVELINHGWSDQDISVLLDYDIELIKSAREVVNNERGLNDGRL